MDSSSSSGDEDDEGSDVFYSCDSDYNLSVSNNSPMKSASINNILDGSQEVEKDPEDPISRNILRKLSISHSNTNLNNTSHNNNTNQEEKDTKVRFSESNVTYSIEEEDDEEIDNDDEGEKENKKVGVEIKKVFTRIITKAEEVQKNVASRIERKKEKDIQIEHARTTQSPTKWFKELIGPHRPALQIPKNSVASYARRKSKREFGSLVCVQTIDVHDGAIWAMKFSFDGTLMASGGQDGLLRLWKVNTDKLFSNLLEFAYFQKPHAYSFQGHNGDILDISWSKTNKRILSASMDRTVRLWHLDKEECVHSFQHTDIVTSVTFHPTDDNLFLSGSLDNKLMLWNIELKSVVYTVDTHEFITTVAFTLNGKLAIAGLHSGMCTFYSTEGFAPAGKLYVHSSRGKNKKGKKISGIEPLPDGKNILITSNDSRMRLYKLDDFTCECKYKGLVNNSFQIRGTCNANGSYVICGSEDNMVYIWNTHNDCTMFSPADNIPIIGASSRRDINSSYECFATNPKQPTVVTVALFAPHTPPNLSPRANGEERITPQSSTPPSQPTTPPPPFVPPHDDNLSSSTSSISSTSSLSSSVSATSTSSSVSSSTNSKKTPQASSPPHKTLHHRNSISSIINLITPIKGPFTNKSATLPSPLHPPSHHTSHASHPTNTTPPTTPLAKSAPAEGTLSSSSSSSISAPSTPTSLSSSNDVLPPFATSPPASSSPTTLQKRGTGGAGGIPKTGMELLIDEQQVYIITADASGQIKVFENAPTPLSPSPATSPVPSPYLSPTHSPAIPTSPPPLSLPLRSSLDT